MFTARILTLVSAFALLIATSVMATNPVPGPCCNSSGPKCCKFMMPCCR